METKKTFIDHDQERQALGGILINSDVLFNSIQIFIPEMFDNPEHMTIAKVVVELFNKGDMVDSMNVIIGLREKRFQNLSYVSELTQNLPYTSGYEKIIFNLHALWISRKANRVIESYHYKLHSENDSLESLEGLQRELTEVLNISTIASEVKGGKVYQNVVAKIEEVLAKPNKLVGIDTGIDKANLITGGWQGSDLIVIAARPGMGKTSFMLTSAKAAAFIQKRKVGIISLEMTNEQLMNKLIAIDTRINVQRIKSINLDRYEVEAIKAVKTQLNDNFIFEDKINTINQIRSKCRQMVVKYGVEAVYIDYLQLITNKGKGNREQEISEITRTLKSTAKELNIPIIALSQLSRSVEQRGGEKMPQLSDLRESGAIEQDADIVCFPHRPNYYDDQDLPIEENACLIIAKNRNGATGKIEMYFEGKTTNFICPNRHNNSFNPIKHNTEF